MKLSFHLWQSSNLRQSLLFILLLLISHAGHVGTVPSPKYIDPLPGDRFLLKEPQRTCHAGAVYTIQTVDDLISQLPELECIYAAGKAPPAVPLGLHYGTVLKFISTDTLTPFIAALWKGKLTVETRCPNPLVLALNVISNRLRVTALLNIGIPHLNLGDGEYTDGKPTLVIDYTKDFGSLCTDSPGSFYGSKDLSLDILNNVFPFNLLVDVVRVVGRQADNGLIYLGKTYLLDPYNPNGPAYNIAYWSIVNYDPVVKNPIPGDSLAPLTKTFHYMEAGIWKAAQQITPFDDLLRDPAAVLDQFFQYFDSFANVIKSNIGVDIKRSLTRTNRVLCSRIGFLISSVSAVLTRNPSLLDGLSSDSVAQTLLEGASIVGLEERGLDQPEFSDLMNIWLQLKQSDQTLVGAEKPRSGGKKQSTIYDLVATPQLTLFELAKELRRVIAAADAGERVRRQEKQDECQ